VNEADWRLLRVVLLEELHVVELVLVKSDWVSSQAIQRSIGDIF
jgi:hypothetical protein